MEAAVVIPEEGEATLSVPRIRANPWLVLVGLALGEFMILLDTLIVAVAIPDLSSNLHASFDQVLWVVNAYSLVFAVLLITAGRLGDMYGPKKLFLTGLSIFTLASVGCALAQSPDQLIAFRVIQAAGGAILIPQTLAVIASIFPRDKQGAAFGAWSAVAGVAVAAGPPLGGVLTSSFSWRAVFLPNVPIGIAAIILAVLMMPEVIVKRPRSIDVVGMILASLGLVGFIFVLIENEKYRGGPILDVATFKLGSFRTGPVSIPTVGLASLILLGAFIVWELRQDEPLLPLSLLHDRNFSIGSGVTSVVNFALLGLFLPLTLFLQSVLGFSAVKAGLVLLPNALAGMVSAPIAGRLTDKVNGKYLLVIGLVLIGAGMALLAGVVSLGATAATFIAPLVVTGLGVGFTMAPVTALSMRNVAASAAGSASGFLNTVRQVGAALGAAVAGAILATRLAGQSHDQAVRYSAHLPSSYRDSFIDASQRFSQSGLKVGVGQTHLPVPHDLPSTLAATWVNLGSLVFNHAFVIAMRPALLSSVPLLLLATLLTLRMRTAALPAVVPQPGAGPVPSVPVRVAAPMNVSNTVIVPLALRPSRPVRPLRQPFIEPVGSGGRRYLLQQKLTIGRDSSNDIVVQDPGVSRTHAILFPRDNAIMIQDLGSINGTLVNGERISAVRALSDGDVVAVHTSAFVYHNDFQVANPRIVDATNGTEYPIRGLVRIGRLPSNDIVINASDVSRNQAQLFIHEGRIKVRDLESLNGTRINGELVVGDQPLRDGDTLQAGSRSFVFHNDKDVGRVG